MRDWFSILQKILLCLCFLFCLLSCGEHNNDQINHNKNESKSLEPKLVQIYITPLDPSIDINEQQQFVAIGTYSDQSTKDITSSVAWSSSNREVATIELAKGLATGIAYGTTQIVAISGDVYSNVATLNIMAKQAAEIIKIDISASHSKVFVRHTLQFNAIATYSDNTREDVTNKVKWKSSNPNIATINESNGIVSGLKIGITEISASLDVVSSANISLEVIPSVFDLRIVSKSCKKSGPYSANINIQLYNNDKEDYTCYTTTSIRPYGQCSRLDWNFHSQTTANKTIPCAGLPNQTGGYSFVMSVYCTNKYSEINHLSVNGTCNL